jgi:hypothetical protein
VVVIDQLADPQKAWRVRSCELCDPLAQLLGILAADRHRSGRRPQRGADNLSFGGIALVVAQERTGKDREELRQQPLSPVIIRDRPSRQGVVEEGPAEPRCSVRNARQAASSVKRSNR